MTDSNTALGTDKLPLTVSDLLGLGEPGGQVIKSIAKFINTDCQVYSFLNVRDAFWNDASYRENGWVYLMHAEGTSYYKIGKSIDPVTRLKQISPKMPFKTLIAGARPTNYMSLLEKIYHHLYRGYRSNGEWFEFSQGNAINDLTPFIKGTPAKLENMIGRAIAANIFVQDDELAQAITSENAYSLAKEISAMQEILSDEWAGGEA